METGWSRRKNIQLCYPLEESRLFKWKPPYLCQPKYDGERCRAVPIEKGYLLLSSEENVFFSVPHIVEDINKLRWTGYEFDGELYAQGLPFEQIVSIVSRTKNLHPDHTQISYHIFDIILDTEESQMERSGRLLRLKSDIGRITSLKITPHDLAYSIDGVMQFYESYLENGYEGIIVRNLAAPYIRRRSTYVMKFKPSKEDIYEITGTVEEVTEDGSPKGRLGSFECKGGDGTTFNVGSGLNIENRIKFWNNREDLVGKKVRVSYQHLTAGKRKPRFPVFMEVISE